jgi:hypothetical protein
VGGGAIVPVTTAVAVGLTGSVASTEGVSAAAVSEAAGAAVSTWAWAGRLAGPKTAASGMSDKLSAATVIKRITISTREPIIPFSPEARLIRPFLNFSKPAPGNSSNFLHFG